MSEKSVIHDRLRKKEAEAQALEDKLRSARIYVQALTDILRALDGEGSSNGELKAGTMIAQARDAILKAKRPLHVDDLLTAIGRPVDSKSSLTGSLAAYVRREEIFTRPAPNTYGLIAMRSDAPPPDFGGSSSAKKPVFGSSADFADDSEDDVPF